MFYDERILLKPKEIMNYFTTRIFVIVDCQIVIKFTVYYTIKLINKNTYILSEKFQIEYFLFAMYI